MKNLLHIHRGANVTPIALGLRRFPHLWNANTDRTASPDSPHHYVDDIWARYAAPNQDRTGPHFSEWYEAADLIPEIKDHARAVMNLVKGDALGGVLITRIPPGRMVLPHTDPGWHARYYDKFCLQIASHPQQAFCYDDDSHVSEPGDVFWFNNAESHWVTNDSPVERISMIVCVKLSKPFGGA